MPNAKQEFLDQFEDDENPEALFEGAHLKDRENKPWLVFTAKEYTAFLKFLDFSYSSGHGAQELFGFIFLVGGRVLRVRWPILT